LNQTSGLPATAGGPLLRSVGDGDRAALLAELEGTRLWAEPGAAFQYSNANYVLLGMVVEEAAGMAYGEYVKTRIFDPLKMSDSFVSASAAKRSGLAVGHRYWFGFAVPHGPTSPEGIRAAGYLMSSAADMGRYLSMFLNDGVFEGRRLVSRQGLRTLLTPAAPATLGAWSGHQESEYAMGWFVGGPWREQAILHPGGTPDSSSMIVLLPKSRRAVVTLANANMELPIPGADGSTDRIARGVVSLLVGEQPEPGMSLNWFYVIFDLFVVVIIGLLVLSVTRLVRRVQAPGVARRRFSTYAGGIGELLLGLVLVAAPVLLGQGYAGMFLWTPDLALVLLVIGGLMSLAGALRVASGGRPRT
jgi:CubicO group peptidase (beta-lactamase class C family)